MRNIYDCVNAFLPLLNTEYELVLGRKGVAVTLRLESKCIFHDRGRLSDEKQYGKQKSVSVFIKQQS